MAHTFSKSANVFIDNNIKTKTNIQAAEIAVNMAVSDVVNIAKQMLVEFCPHKEICTRQYQRGGCDCSYLYQRMNRIKGDETLCYSKK